MSDGAILSTPGEDDQEVIALNDSEESFSFLNAPDPVGPQTSTPVKGKNTLEFHMMSYGESHSLSESVQSVGSLDSGTLTPPDISILDIAPQEHLTTDSVFNYRFCHGPG